MGTLLSGSQYHTEHPAGRIVQPVRTRKERRMFTFRFAAHVLGAVQEKTMSMRPNIIDGFSYWLN